MVVETLSPPPPSPRPSPPSRTASSGARSPPSTAAAARAPGSSTRSGSRPPTGLVGWLTSRPTPLRRAHLAATPYVSCSYWDPAHDVAVAECAAAWVEDPRPSARVGGLQARSAARRLRPRHDLARRPSDPGAAVIRLDPWRLKAADAATLAAGGEPQVWRRP